MIGGCGLFSAFDMVHAQAQGTTNDTTNQGEVLNVEEAIKINDDDCLRWVWAWCFDVEKLIFPKSDIDNLNKRRTVMTITQDVVYWATRMVWTVLTIALIFCGLMYIYSARSGSGKWTETYRKWLIAAAVWALLVRWAYAIVRLIQYIAKW